MFSKLRAFLTYIRLKIEKIFTPERTLIVSFALVIFSGTVLLMLPQATIGEPLNFVDALFTATSATCVTGLIVVDTGSKFTLFGQLIILMLIQAGGLGIMTFSTAFLFLLEGRFSMGSRDVLQQTLGQMPVQNIRSLVMTVFLGTFFN